MKFLYQALLLLKLTISTAVAVAVAGRWLVPFRNCAFRLQSRGLSVRFLFRFTLSFLLVFSPIHSLQAEQGLGNSTERAMAEEAFFLDLRFRIEQFMYANIAKSKMIRTCLQNEIGPKRAAIDKNVCAAELEIIRNNIRILYPKMRHYLITRDLLMPANHAATYELKKPYPDLEATAHSLHANKTRPKILGFFNTPNPAKQLRKDIENPLDSRFDGIKMPFPAPTATELKRAIEGFRSKDGTVSERGYGVHQFYREACLKSFVTYPNTLTVKEKIPAAICNQISLKFDSKTGKTSWHFASAAPIEYLVKNTRPGQKAITPPGKSSYDLRIDRILEGWYHETIQANPYVALVPSSRPSNQELLWAFDQIYRSGIRTLMRFSAEQAKLDRERASLFTKAWEWLSHNGHRTRTLELMNYSPILGHLLEVPGSKMDLLYGYPFQELAQTLLDEHSTHQLKKTGTQLVGLIGANFAVCWLPWSRAASTVGRLARVTFKGGKVSKVLSPMCFALASLPINSYFLYDSIHQYTRAYEELFSSPDQDLSGTSSNTHFVREVRALGETRSAIFWSLLFMPAGTKEIRVALKSRFPKLSDNAWARIDRYLAQR